jgi:DNA-binding NarL/FixJ family response regulator
MTRILIADDQALVRGGFGLILAAQADFEVVGEVADGRAAVDAAATLRPDLILMDVRMPEMDGIAATRAILAAPAMHPPKVLMVTTFDLDEYIYDAMRAGASGFLLKDVSPADLVQGIRVVLAGEALLAPTIVRRMIDQYVARPLPTTQRPDRFAELTERELDVLGRLARGLSNAEIAAELYLSAATIKTHVARILAKLGVRDRVHAVIAAYESGLVTPGG